MVGLLMYTVISSVFVLYTFVLYPECNVEKELVNEDDRWMCLQRVIDA